MLLTWQSSEGKTFNFHGCDALFKHIYTFILRTTFYSTAYTQSSRRRVSFTASPPEEALVEMLTSMPGAHAAGAQTAEQ